jgi:hypothetical protein
MAIGGRSDSGKGGRIRLGMVGGGEGVSLHLGVKNRME